jgi:hypothetical protein
VPTETATATTEPGWRDDASLRDLDLRVVQPERHPLAGTGRTPVFVHPAQVLFPVHQVDLRSTQRGESGVDDAGRSSGCAGQQVSSSVTTGVRRPDAPAILGAQRRVVTRYPVSHPLSVAEIDRNPGRAR